MVGENVRPIRPIRPILVALLATVPPDPPTTRESSVALVLETDQVTLQVPVVDLVDGAGRSLVVVGAVHVADPDHYAQIEGILEGRIAITEGVAPNTPLPDDDIASWVSLLADHGLVPQQLALTDGIRADLSASDLEARLIGAGADRAFVEDVFEGGDRERLQTLLSRTDGEPRLIALARLALIRSLADPQPTHGPAADLYWEILIGLRDRVAIAAVADQDARRLAVVYGADHTADLVARLQRAGWRPVAHRRLPAIVVHHGALGLGPVQVRQLLER